MPGTPPFDPTNTDMVVWTVKSRWIPNGRMRLHRTPDRTHSGEERIFDEDLIAALNFAARPSPGDVVSMSFGESRSVPWTRMAWISFAAWQSASRKPAATCDVFALLGRLGARIMDPQGMSAFQNGRGRRVLLWSQWNKPLFRSTTNGRPNGTYQGEQSGMRIGAGGGA